MTTQEELDWVCHNLRRDDITKILGCRLKRENLASQHLGSMGSARPCACVCVCVGGGANIMFIIKKCLETGIYVCDKYRKCSNSRTTCWIEGLQYFYLFLFYACLFLVVM